MFFQEKPFENGGQFVQAFIWDNNAVRLREISVAILDDVI